MKIGIKIYPNNPDKGEYLKRIADVTDFIEVMAVRDADFGFMEDYDIPYVIHNEHFRFGVNLSDSGMLERNLVSVRFSQELADRFNARFIIVHPGLNDNDKCSIENVIKFLNMVNDERILIENLPYWATTGSHCFGRSFDELERIIKACGCGLCLDFGHASLCAYGFKREHVEFVKDLFKLNPVYFHISDGHAENDKDEHMHLGEGNLDLASFKRMIPDSAMVAIETRPELEKQMNDIRFMRSD